MTPTNRYISLRGLRTFCFAAELLSFRDTAEQLYITASAVSHQIKNLEDQLGKKLFERGTRAVTLTLDGELLYKDVKPLLIQLDEVALQHRTAAPRSSLRISVQPFFANELFLPRLQEFRETYPDIDISVDTSTETTEIHPASADASIRVFKTPPTDYVHGKLFPLRFIAAGSNELYDSVKVRAKCIVSNFPVIVHESRPQAWQRWERSSGIRLPRELQTVTLDSMTAVATAAERGVGAALVPTHISDARFKSGRLVPLFDHEFSTGEAYYFAYRKDSNNERNIQLLYKWVLQEFAPTA